MHGRARCPCRDLPSCGSVQRGVKRPSTWRSATLLSVSQLPGGHPFNITRGIIRSRPVQPLSPTRPHRAGRLRIIRVMSGAAAFSSGCSRIPGGVGSGAACENLPQLLHPSSAKSKAVVGLTASAEGLHARPAASGCAGSHCAALRCSFPSRLLPLPAPVRVAMQNRMFPQAAAPQSAAQRHLRASPARARQALRRPQQAVTSSAPPQKPLMTAAASAGMMRSEQADTTAGR